MPPAARLLAPSASVGEHAAARPRTAADSSCRRRSQKQRGGRERARGLGGALDRIRGVIDAQVSVDRCRFQQAVFRAASERLGGRLALRGEAEAQRGGIEEAIVCLMAHVAAAVLCGRRGRPRAASAASRRCRRDRFCSSSGSSTSSDSSSLRRGALVGVQRRSRARRGRPGVRQAQRRERVGAHAGAEKRKEKKRMGETDERDSKPNAFFFNLDPLFRASSPEERLPAASLLSLHLSLSLSRNHLLRFQTLTFITTDISSISGERKNGGGVFVVSLVLLSCFLLLSFSLPFLFPLSPPNSPQPEEAA